MKKEYTIYHTIGKMVVVTMLALLIGWNQLLLPVLAQEPDPAPPEDAGEIDPPTEAELGQPVKDETYVTADDQTDEEGGLIEIRDLAYGASRYNTDDPSADLNLDGTVNILDLAILANNYDQAEPTAEAANIPTPPDLPLVEANGDDFGSFDLPVEPEGLEVESQSNVTWRPLRVGVSINYINFYDYMDRYSSPDPYALVSVGGVPARTRTIYNRFSAWPYWRLGWWRYYSFPRAPWDAPEANYYRAPIRLELRDDDGYVCYGYFGCRDRYQLADVSPPLFRRTKSLTLYPGNCKVVDENGATTTGYWLDNNRCRVYLHSWGTEWPRAYVSYYIDAMWE